MRVDDFDFELPPALIATFPAEPRDAARLLVVRPDGLADRHMLDLPTLLRPGDLMVFNDTRVIPARLTGRRGAARVELTLHRRLGEAEWRAFAKGAKRLRPGDLVVFGEDSFGGEGEVPFAAVVVEKHAEGDLTLRFDRGGDALRAALERHGAPPLPPYIKRPAGLTEAAADRERYQTIYAEKEGAVAAPTAGLHFTERLFDAIAAAGVARAMVTLHVGAGTFLPVKVEDTRDHRMHSEVAFLDEAAARRINAAREAGGRVVAVGTTSLRTLESAADASGRVHPFAGETNLFITPGYRFKAVDLLLTNFHLPRSTLFMLVAAFSGLKQMKSAYEHAKVGGYRFFSYGDACLLHPNPGAGAAAAGGAP